MSYEEQLRFKTKKVQNVMNKTLGQNSVEVLETLGMKDGYHYRNKSVIPVQKVDNEVKMGYYKPRSHDVVNIEKCFIQYDEHNKLMNYTRDLIAEMNLSIYDEKTHKGAIRHIMFRTNSNKTEIMVGIIVNEKSQVLMSLLRR